MSVIQEFKESYLPASIFTRKAYDALERFSTEDFFMRRGDGCKDLVQEVIPIAAFLKYFEIPGRNIKCKYYGSGHKYDAKIRVYERDGNSGWTETEYFLEVTMAVSKKENLVREELAMSGFSFGDKDIECFGSRHKGTRKIVSRPVAEDKYVHPVKSARSIRLSTLVRERLTDKARRQKNYPMPRILLVQCDPGPISLNEWATVCDDVHETIDRSVFALTFIVNCWQNIVFPI